MWIQPLDLSTFGYMSAGVGDFTPFSLATFGYFSGASGQYPPPARTTNLVASSKTTSSVLLTWRFRAYAQYFQIYRADSVTSNFTLIQSNWPDTFYQNKNLRHQYYWYIVRGINESSSGSFSNVAYRKPLEIGIQNTIPRQVEVPTKVNRSESLFFNDRQWQMFKHISKQMVEHVAKQQVYYYQLDDRTMSGRNKIYGQRKKKIWKQPKMLYGRVRRMPVRSDRQRFGYNSTYTVQIYFDKNHLDDKKVNINYMVGNQIQWDHKSLVIKKAQMFDSIMGLSDYKTTVLVTAIYTQD